MKKFAIYNNKGGVGKTTSTINIAYSLHCAGKKVLVVDCDKTQQNSYMFFLSESVNKILPTKYENISNTTYDVFETLKENEYNSYDYIIFDMPPALNDYVLNILKQSDKVFAPIKFGQFEVEGLVRLLDTSIDNVAGIFFTMYKDKIETRHKDDLNMLRDVLKDRLINTVIHYSETIENSQLELLPIGEYLEQNKTPKSGLFWRAFTEYDALTEEIVRRLG